MPISRKQMGHLRYAVLFLEEELRISLAGYLCIRMSLSQALLVNRERSHEVGDRILIAQDLDPPIPNRTGSLSLHTALTESPTFS